MIRTRWIAGLLLCAVFGSGTWWYVIRPTELSSMNKHSMERGENKQSALSQSTSQGLSAITDPHTASIAADPKPSVSPITEATSASRDEKVKRQLETFIQRTSGITAESIAAEKQRIKQGLAKVEAQATELPKVRVVTDAAGERWEQLEYKNGIVRYAPLPKEVK